MAIKLTELEGCVLGLIWERGTCTTYAVRKVFLNSPNPYWSGSAGAIYPLARRLENRGLVRAREDYAGKKRRVLYDLTPKGMDSFQLWLGPAVPDWSFTIPVDPLRTRVRFLGALSQPDRAEFLALARQQLIVQIKDAETAFNSFDKKVDPYRYLVARGVASIAQARLAWIEEVTNLLG